MNGPNGRPLIDRLGSDNLALLIGVNSLSAFPGCQSEIDEGDQDGLTRLEALNRFRGAGFRHPRPLFLKPLRSATHDTHGVARD